MVKNNQIRYKKRFAKMWIVVTSYNFLETKWS